MVTDVELRAVLVLAKSCMQYEYVDKALSLETHYPADVKSVGDVLVRLVSEYRIGRDRRRE